MYSMLGVIMYSLPLCITVVLFTTRQLKLPLCVFLYVPCSQSVWPLCYGHLLVVTLSLSKRSTVYPSLSFNPHYVKEWLLNSSFVESCITITATNSVLCICSNCVLNTFLVCLHTSGESVTEQISRLCPQTLCSCGWGLREYIYNII